MKNCLLILLLLSWNYAFSQINIRFTDVSLINDIVINEIFADPNPQVDLPAAEFAELWNTTGKTISLKNWVYADAATKFTFGNDSIKPNEFLIICAKADTAEFKKFGRVIGLSPWPSLNNSGDNITLRNNQNTLINQVSYTDAWYQDAVKKQGGWSLELINPKAACTGIQNWGASTDPSGGTPGRQNSVYKNTAAVGPLKLVSAILIDSITLQLSFNRSVDSLFAAKTSNYSVNNGVGNPVSALPVSPRFEQVTLRFANAIARGNNYTITAGNLTDCAGSVISSLDNSAEFIIAKKIVKGDILVNEVLFNPRASGVDFVEIYNNSASTLDLKELFIATVKDKDSLVSVKQVREATFLMQPGQYLVLTADPDNIKKEYQTENPDGFIRMASLPAFNDEDGVVILLSGNTRIDQLNYTDKMHFPLIKNAEGVSLERSSFNRSANDPGNFRSAAAAIGYATPAYKNSQYADDVPTKDEIMLTSATFSPDNDGFEDALLLTYHFNRPGLVANISVYNDKGILIRKLTKNMTLSTEGTINWDGLNELNERAPTGIYVIYAEIFDLNGQVKKYRKTCALAAKFD